MKELYQSDNKSRKKQFQSRNRSRSRSDSYSQRRRKRISQSRHNQKQYQSKRFRNNYSDSRSRSRIQKNIRNRHRERTNSDRESRNGQYSPYKRNFDRRYRQHYSSERKQKYHRKSKKDFNDRIDKRGRGRGEEEQHRSHSRYSNDYAEKSNKNKYYSREKSGERKQYYKSQERRYQQSESRKQNKKPVRDSTSNKYNLNETSKNIYQFSRKHSQDRYLNQSKRTSSSSPSSKYSRKKIHNHQLSSTSPIMANSQNIVASHRQQIYNQFYINLHINLQYPPYPHISPPSTLQLRSRNYNNQHKAHYSQISESQLQFSPGSSQNSNHHSKTSSKSSSSSHSSYDSQSSQSGSSYDSSDQQDRSQDAGHYQYQIGQILNNRFKILNFIADGTFGRVFEVIDLEKVNVENGNHKITQNSKTNNQHQIYDEKTNSNQTLALKMIRAVPRYVDSAKTECEIIEEINRRDPNSLYPIVRLYESFRVGDNFAMIFEPLGDNLYEIIKRNNYKGFPIQIIQSIFQEILEGIGFMHVNQLTHTDLKPQNILLQQNGFKNYDLPYPKQRTIQIPVEPNIQIIDFGGATWDHEHHSEIINTRQYRAPEVLLNCMKWNEKSDMWCIACIIVELYSGNLAFPTHDNIEHLGMMCKFTGDLPQWMMEKSSKEFKDHFTRTSNGHDSRLVFEWAKEVKSKSVEQIRELKLLEDIILPAHSDLIDLLQKLFVFNPSERWDCQLALQHQFFQNKYSI